ncbi:unnamed protein product [Chrysoparadoxa australica]
MSDNKKIGTGLLVLGFVFLTLGVLMFFDSGLLAIGDLLFLAGITMTIGVRRAVVFFFKRKQLRGNIFFFGGIVLVLMKWAVVGMVLQVETKRPKHTYTLSFATCFFYQSWEAPTHLKLPLISSRPSLHIPLPGLWLPQFVWAIHPHCCRGHAGNTSVGGLAEPPWYFKPCKDCGRR